MKKFLLFALLVFVSLFLLMGCSGKQETALNVNYDYGQVVKGKATLLYDSNVIYSLNISAPEKPLVAGDRLVLEYRGTLLTALSYPGQMHLDGEIINSYYQYTSVIKIDKNNITRNENGGIQEVNSIKYSTKYVVINEDMDILPLSEYKGENLFASIDLSMQDSEDNGIYIASFYAYNPRIS